MDALVTAGGVPAPGEYLYEETQGKAKALIDIHGKPMIQWVLEALCQAQSIDSIVIIGPVEPSDLDFPCSKPLSFLPGQGGMIQNIRAGVQHILSAKPDARHVLTVSSDIPGITSQMVDWVVRTASETDHDIYYNVITRQVMEERYPNSRRTFTRLKDYEVCGGDMNMIRARTVTANESLWEKIVASRKSVIKQAALVGFDTLLLLLLRQLRLENGVERVCNRLEISGRVLFCPYAEVGMDVDKPHQLEMMRQDLAQRVAV